MQLCDTAQVLENDDGTRYGDTVIRVIVDDCYTCRWHVAQLCVQILVSRCSITIQLIVAVVSEEQAEWGKHGDTAIQTEYSDACSSTLSWCSQLRPAYIVMTPDMSSSISRSSDFKSGRQPHNKP